LVECTFTLDLLEVDQLLHAFPDILVVLPLMLSEKPGYLSNVRAPPTRSGPVRFARCRGPPVGIPGVSFKRITAKRTGDMLTEYIRAAMGRARYEILDDDRSFYGEIPGFDGVWANAETLEGCREELEEIF